MAPGIVMTSLIGAALFAEVFSSLGYKVCPQNGATRSDMTQAIILKTEKELISFIRAIQKASPVDNKAVPYAGDMPGYEDKIIMASGSFIQGSTIELSADAPVKPPFIAYFQGGLTLESIRLSLMLALKDIKAIK
jgi:cystathionine beta-lyase family protein involved in aluminum resistance